MYMFYLNVLTLFDKFFFLTKILSDLFFYNLIISFFQDDDCKILWCKLYDLYSDVAVHCVTTNTKWADGTACGLSEVKLKKNNKSINQ